MADERTKEINRKSAARYKERQKKEQGIIRRTVRMLELGNNISISEEDKNGYFGNINEYKAVGVYISNVEDFEQRVFTNKHIPILQKVKLDVLINGEIQKQEYTILQYYPRILITDYEELEYDMNMMNLFEKEDNEKNYSNQTFNTSNNKDVLDDDPFC